MNDTVMKGLLSAICLCLSITVFAQGGYKQLPGGMAYKFLHDEKGGQTPGVGDYVEAHMYLDVDGNNVYNSRKVGEGNPVSFVIQEQSSGADIQPAIMKMTPGDSAAVLISIDSMLAAGSQQYPWMKPNTGQKAIYTVKVLSVRKLGE